MCQQGVGAGQYNEVKFANINRNKLVAEEVNSEYPAEYFNPLQEEHSSSAS